jgi:AraC-like DNA-binding protein
MAALTVSEAAFRQFGGEGRAPADGIRYSCSIPVGGERLAWQARLGTGGSQYRVDKRLVTSRTSFFEVSSCAAGGQDWQFGGDDSHARSPVLYLLAPVRGQLRVRHVGTETLLSPGQYTVGTSARPLAAGYGDRSRVIMAFAGEKDLDRGGRLTSALGRAMRVDETGGLLFRHLDATLRVAGSLGPGSLTAAAGAAGDLMAAALAGLPPGGAGVEAALRSQVETFIELRLRDPELGVRQIAAAHYVSRRTVYRLFEDADEGVASYIRARRLDRCRADLIECPDLSVAAICERWVMGEPRHFARKYRARFGENPVDTRHRDAALPEA